jgi:hypothetical protein
MIFVEYCPFCSQGVSFDLLELVKDCSPDKTYGEGFTGESLYPFFVFGCPSCEEDFSVTLFTDITKGEAGKCDPEIGTVAKSRAKLRLIK